MPLMRVSGSVLLIVCALVFGHACSESKFSCVNKELSICDESPADKAKALQSFCSGPDQQFAKSGCPQAALVGCCVAKQGTKCFYNTGGAPYTTKKAEAYCKEYMGGTLKAK